MTNFEQDIQRITEDVLQDGTVEKIIREKIQKGFENAIEDLFKWGELKKAVENRIKEVLVPFIENYDMSDYIVKLDTVLTEIVNNTALADNAKIIGNFKNLMIEPKQEVVTLKEIFAEYKQHVSEYMDTCGRRVDSDDGEPEYEPMGVTAEIIEDEAKSWSSMESAVLKLGVDEENQQDDLNFSIRLTRWKFDKEKGKGYEITCDGKLDIKGLRRMSDFEVYIQRLARADVRLSDNDRYESDEVYSVNKPEATFK